MAKTQIKRVRPKHEHIVDLMLAAPELKQGQIAKMLGVTEAWLSQVINSDAFKAYYAMRRKEHSEKVSKSVIERVEDLAHETLDVLYHRVRNEGEMLKLRDLKDTAEMTLKALGYGGKETQSVNIMMIDKESLFEARERYRKARIERQNSENLIEYSAGESNEL